jgi:hypothetical protein
LANVYRKRYGSPIIGRLKMRPKKKGRRMPVEPESKAYILIF